MPAPRKSAYRRSYGADKMITGQVALTPEMRKAKEAEKEKMKKCNNRLVNYIDKVHDLVEANKVLKAENGMLRKTSGKDKEQDLAALYEDELQRLRIKVEEITVENQRLEIERSNLQYDCEEISEKYETEVEEKEKLEKEVKDLRKDVDDATIERVSLESKLENLQETLQLERQAHTIEVENLRSHVQPVQAMVVENEPSSLMPDLTDAIQSVRLQYESFNNKNLESLEAFYKEKLENMSKHLQTTKEDNKSIRQENGEQRKTIHHLEHELEALRNKNDTLDRQITEIEEKLEKQNDNADVKIIDLTRELDDAKLDLAKYLKDYHDLYNLKLSLEQEIAIYHKLLQGEEDRNIYVETADIKTTRPASRGRSRSRSRSRSGSRAKSGSKSRSRSRSSSRSSSDDGQQKQEEDTKGVVSVTWKVKGGTVRPFEPFDPSDDAEKLRKAIKKFGTDEGVIINILGKRSKAQRMVIAEKYHEKFGDDLIKDLKAELSGDLKVVALHLMWKRSEMDANALRKAVQGLGTDEAVLIEILCTQTSREIQEIKDSYAEEFPGRSLEGDIAYETTGSFKEFLLAVLRASRPVDSGTVFADQADQDAKDLFKMSVKDWSPSHPKFLEIFTQRSFEHLWFMFNESWPKVSTDNLLETVEKECKGDLKKGIMALIRFSVYIPPLYYATQIHEAIKGFGTEDGQLIYIVTTRSEIDMIDIKEEFAKKYNETLVARIQKETSGDYKKMLVTLIDEDFPKSDDADFPQSTN